MFYGDLPQIEVPTALNQQMGPTQRMGMDDKRAQEKARAEARLRVEQPKVAESIKRSPKPRSARQVAQKMSANRALPASAQIVNDNAPFLALLIAKGADPIEAARALQSMQAFEYSLCNQKMQDANIADKPLLAKLRADQKLRNMLGRFKQNTFQNLIEPNPKWQVDSAVQAANIYESIDDILGGRKFLDPSLVNCLIEGARLEAEMEYKVLFGNEGKMLIASGELDPEQATELVESGEILKQASETGVQNEGIIGETDDDKKYLSILGTYATPMNLGLVILGLGAMYLIFGRR